MKKKKHPIPIILFILAAIIVILGIVQLALYISPQLTMLEEAAAQGATAEQISEYYWQQLIPQIVTYIITSLGIAALLFSSGVIYQKLSQLLNSAFNNEFPVVSHHAFISLLKATSLAFTSIISPLSIFETSSKTLLIGPGH